MSLAKMPDPTKRRRLKTRYPKLVYCSHAFSGWTLCAQHPMTKVCAFCGQPQPFTWDEVWLAMWAAIGEVVLVDAGSRPS